MESRLVLARLLQADGALKTRPALVLRVLRPFDDLLICGITSQLRQAVVGFDELVEQTDADFATSGLRTPSLIRLGYLGVLPQNKLIGDVGVISTDRYRRLLQRLSDYLKP